MTIQTRKLTWAIHLLLAVCLLTLPVAVRAQTVDAKKNKPKHYVFGVLPFMSPLALYKRFSPLRDYLNTRMDQEIILESSRNFTEHLRALRNRKYDFVLTAPHFVLPVTEDGQYRVIATYTKPLSAVVVTHKNSSITSMEQLKGHTVSTPPPKAIITIIGKRLLTNATGIEKGAIKFVDYPSHNSAIHTVLAGESQAAVVAVYVYLGALKAKKPLKLIARSHEFPAVGILAAKDLPQKDVDRFIKSLTSMRRTSAGRAALRQMSFPGYRKASRQEYESLREIKIPQATHQPFYKTKSP